MWNDSVEPLLLYRPQAYALCSNTMEHSEGMFYTASDCRLKKGGGETEEVSYVPASQEIFVSIHPRTSVCLTLALSSALLSRSRCPQATTLSVS